MIAVSESDRIIANVNATMSMEGMPLTELDKARIRDCIDGRKSFDETVRELIEKYRKQI